MVAGDTLRVRVEVDRDRFWLRELRCFLTSMF